MTGERDSLEQQAAQVARAWRVVVPVGVVLMAAATWGASWATTAAGLARAEHITDLRAHFDKRIGPPENAKDKPPIYDRIDVLELAKTAGIESVGLTVEEVVGLRVALHRTTTVAKLTTAQRTAIEAASVAARKKYRDLVLQSGDVHQSASQVLAEAGVPR